MKVIRKFSYTTGSAVRKTRKRLNFPINQKLIRFCGIQRSGNHAVINWIIAQEQLRTCFINGAFPGSNPWDKNWGISYPNFPYWPKARDLKGALVGKELFVFSYENQSLADIELDKQNLSNYIGTSRQEQAVIILRDPYNTFASWLKRNTPITPDIVALWKSYAREFLGKSKTIGSPKVCISFNQWFSNQDYRQELACKLGLKFTDRGIADVSHHGGGSSFDGQTLEGSAKKMNVLTRYHHYKEMPQFQEIFKNDSELGLLSYEIFGDLP